MSTSAASNEANWTDMNNDWGRGDVILQKQWSVVHYDENGWVTAQYMFKDHEEVEDYFVKRVAVLLETYGGGSTLRKLEDVPHVKKETN